MTLVGSRLPRIDGPAKVSGATAYIDDKPFCGLYGATVRTPIARGRIRGIRFLDGPDWREFVIVTARDATSSAESSFARHAPVRASARSTRRAFATVGSIRMSISRVARVVPHS